MSETEAKSYLSRELLAEILGEALGLLEKAATLAESLQDDELLKTLDDLREQVDNLI